MNRLTRKIVEKALNNVWSLDGLTRSFRHKISENQSSITSRLIYDSFGGEILKTRLDTGWHFYNRIDGVRLDFAIPEIEKSSHGVSFEDIPSNPDETGNYFHHEDYITQFLRFIRAFEEITGLNRRQIRVSA
ncbi:MAG: hypothetical protein JXN62_00820 [Bacteroidales bacterium]|nr:hypothetical protein [Bacteroidales bacterium]